MSKRNTGPRAGFYVEGKFYRDNFHQALARARFLSAEYGRAVEVWTRANIPGESEDGGVEFVQTTVINFTRRAA